MWKTIVIIQIRIKNKYKTMCITKFILRIKKLLISEYHKKKFDE